MKILKSVSTRLILVILVIIIFIGFFAFGTTSLITSLLHNNYAIKVASTTMGKKEFIRRYNAELALRINGKSLSSIQVNMAKKDAVDSVIYSFLDSSLYKAYGNDLHLAVTQKMIVNSIRVIPNFLDSKQNFQRRYFNAYLNETGYSERNFIELVKSQIIKDQIINNMISPVMVPSNIVDNMLEVDMSTYTLKYELFSTDNFKVKSPSTPEMLGFYNKNKNDFIVPNHRIINYIPLDIASLNIKVSKSDIAKTYQRFLDNFAPYEERNVTKYSFINEKEAQNSLKLAENKKSFIQGSVSQINDVVLKDMKADSVTARAIFNTKINKYSAIIHVNNTWSFFKINKITKVSAPKLPAVRASIIALAKSIKGNPLLLAKVEEVNKYLQQNTSLKKISENINIPIKTIDITANGEDFYSHKKVLGIPTNQTFLNTVFSLASGHTSQLRQINRDVYFVAFVKQSVQAHQQTFNEAKSEILKTLSIINKNKNAIKELSQRIITNPKGIKYTHSFTFSPAKKTTRPVSLQTIQLTSLAMHKQNTPFLLSINDHNIAIVTITAVKHPAKINQTIREEYLNNTYKNINADILSNMFKYLVAKYKPSFNDEFLNSLVN